MPIHHAPCPDCRLPLVVLVCSRCPKVDIFRVTTMVLDQSIADWFKDRDELCDQCITDLFAEATAVAPARGMPPAPARHSDPGTSHKGAADVQMRAGTQRMKLLIAYADATIGLTADEAAAASGMLLHAAGKRVSELLQLGLIEHRGEERAGVAGSDQRVHHITPAGIAAVRR